MHAIVPKHTSIGQVVDGCHTLSKQCYGIGYAYDGEHHFGSYNNMNKHTPLVITCMYPWVHLINEIHRLVANLRIVIFLNVDFLAKSQRDFTFVVSTYCIFVHGT